MMKQLAKQLRTTLGFGTRNKLSDVRVGVEFPFVDSKTALIVHGLHKSATMFLYKFFSDLCSRVDVPLYSIHESKLPTESTDHSFVLCPVRSFDTDSFTFPALKIIRHLYQIRDPRDVLVSEYYSIGWRHSTEGWSQEDLDRRSLIQSISIDEYVVREAEISKYPLLDRFAPLMKLESGSYDVIKYETMVTDFPNWLVSCLAALDIDATLPANVSFAATLAELYRNEFSADESESAHKRNVTPGDHRNKLMPETIEKLNDRFEAALQAFDY